MVCSENIRNLEVAITEGMASAVNYDAALAFLRNLDDNPPAAS
jgi:hypothetical protein